MLNLKKVCTFCLQFYLLGIATNVGIIIHTIGVCPSLVAFCFISVNFSATLELVEQRSHNASRREIVYEIIRQFTNCISSVFFICKIDRYEQIRSEKDKGLGLTPNIYFSSLGAMRIYSYYDNLITLFHVAYM